MTCQVAEDGLPPISSVLKRYGIVQRTRHGQHFIHDMNFTRRLARAGDGVREANVLEVGAGPGGLTRALLLEGARHVTAVERDLRCLPALEEIAARWPGKLDILVGDALELDFARSLDGRGGVTVVSNLPYQIAAPLLTRWVSEDDWLPWWSVASIMVQKEMADRIVASPGTHNYGRLSVLLQWRTQAKVEMTVPPEVFVPPPKVQSSLLRLTPLAKPEDGFAARDLARATGAAFGNRRKMLRSSLASLGVETELLLSAAGLSPQLRAQDVPVSGYCAFARCLANSPTASNKAFDSS